MVLLNIIILPPFFGPTLSSWHTEKRRERKNQTNEKNGFSAKTAAALRPERTEAEGAPRPEREERSSYVDIFLAPDSGAREKERRSRRVGGKTKRRESGQRQKRISPSGETRERKMGCIPFPFDIYIISKYSVLYAYSNVDTPSLTCRGGPLLRGVERERRNKHWGMCVYMYILHGAPLQSATRRHDCSWRSSHTLEKKEKQRRRIKLKRGKTRKWQSCLACRTKQLLSLLSHPLLPLRLSYVSPTSISE
jgi:hypothetical protein